MGNDLGLPKKVQIGPLEFEVLVVEDLCNEKRERLAGQIVSSATKIYIDADMTAQYAKVVLWHEVIHGILEAAGFADNHDEQMIDALAHGIVDVGKRNQGL